MVFFQVLSFVVGFFENIIKNPMVFAKMGVKNNMFFLQRNTCDLKPELFLKQMFVGTQIIGLSILQGVFFLAISNELKH